jgi:hypothetical protein
MKMPRPEKVGQEEMVTRKRMLAVDVSSYNAASTPYQRVDGLACHQRILDYSCRLWRRDVAPKVCVADVFGLRIHWGPPKTRNAIIPVHTWKACGCTSGCHGACQAPWIKRRAELFSLSYSCRSPDQHGVTFGIGKSVSGHFSVAQVSGQTWPAIF